MSPQAFCILLYYIDQHIFAILEDTCTCLSMTDAGFLWSLGWTESEFSVNWLSRSELLTVLSKLACVAIYNLAEGLTGYEMQQPSDF